MRGERREARVALQVVGGELQGVSCTCKLYLQVVYRQILR